MPKLILGPLGTELIARAGTGPAVSSADALLDISTILQLKGNHEVAFSIQHGIRCRAQQLYHLPAPLGTTGIRLLALMTPGNLMANMPLDFLLEDSDIALDILYVAPSVPVPDTVPDHDVLFVAIGESDESLPLLDKLNRCGAQAMAQTGIEPGRTHRLAFARPRLQAFE